MRILQINAVYGTKSTGRSCKELHDWAVDSGHEMLTVYGNGPKIDVPETEAIFLGSAIEHKAHALTGRLAGDAGIGSWRATRHLLGIIHCYKPDVVHLRNLHGNFVHIPMLLRFLAKENIPTVIHNHDCFWFTGGCMHYTANKCDGWRRDCSECRFLRRGKNFLIKNHAHEALMRKTELFSSIPRLAAIGVSKWTADQIRKSTALCETPIIDYVYNWIDLDVFRPQEADKDMATRAALGIKEGEIMILGVASDWGANKGLDHFMLLRSLLPVSSHICLVGKMDANITLPDGIIALGATESTEKLASLYSTADVFVHLSLEETFGKVTAEALACGTPAIVYNSTASPELVSTDTGAVVAPRDIDAVAEAIPRLVAARLGRTCRHRAQTLFDPSTNCRRQMEIYTQTIELKWEK